MAGNRIRMMVFLCLGLAGVGVLALAGLASMKHARAGEEVASAEVSDGSAEPQTVGGTLLKKALTAKPGAEAAADEVQKAPVVFTCKLTKGVKHCTAMN